MVQNLAKHYQALGLEPGASLEEVNQAYKDLVFIWHPDRLPQENERLIQKSVEKLQQINEARDSLRSYHRQNPKAAKTKTTAKKESRSTTYSSTSYSNSDRTSQDPYRSYSDRGYSSNRTRDPYRGYSSYSNNNYRNTSDRTSSQKSDRANSYSQSNSQQTRTHRPRDTWDYRAYYYSPQNAGDKNARTKDGYQDFRESSRSYSKTSQPDTNYKRPYQKSLRGADLSHSNFKERDFSGRDLTQANLSYADLSDTFLHKIILEKANLQGANLKGANLLQANLRGANLKEANLIGADLSGSDLSGADFTGAKVGFNDKIMVKLTAVKLTGATLPDGSIHP